eukprot:TRINITY_DN9079_c0_g2_i1.p1 TRINITY_DN9079_c0_g2~~TRINITY_DN9079_c0_g2_i1.p1  ORF type:complete len:746 (-),score=181.84 TRINITY_DN9079_c0_g2_i1:8-2245(-)
MKQIDISQMNRSQRSEALNEAKILQSLTSPYIVAYHNSFIENEKLCIVMEYCESGDLSQHLKSRHGRLVEEDTIWKLFIEVCLALLYLHSRKILHRDIKTMNVFMTKDFHVRLGDLGVAKVLSQNTNFARTIVGTPYYLSPELCQEKPYNEKSDVWSLGCVLYEMCALKHPFESRNQAGLMMKIIQGRYEPLSNVYSKELTEIVSLCLQKDYRRRPSIHDILAMSSVQLKARAFKISIPDKGVLSVRPTPKKPTPEPPIINSKAVEHNKKEVKKVPNAKENKKEDVSHKKIVEPIITPQIKHKNKQSEQLQKEYNEVYKLIDNLDKKTEGVDKKKPNPEIKNKVHEHKKNNINVIDRHVYRSNQQLKSPEQKEVHGNKNSPPKHEYKPSLDQPKKSPKEKGKNEVIIEEVKKLPQAVRENKQKLVDHKPTPIHNKKEIIVEKIKKQPKPTPKVKKNPLSSPNIHNDIKKEAANKNFEINMEKLKPKPLPRPLKEAKKMPIQRPPIAKNRKPIVSSNKINEIVRASRPYTANKDSGRLKSKMEEEYQNEIREVANLPDFVGDKGRNSKDKKYKVKKPTLEDIFGEKKDVEESSKAELTPSFTENTEDFESANIPHQEILNELTSPLLMPVGYEIGSEKVDGLPVAKEANDSAVSDSSSEREASELEEQKDSSNTVSTEETLQNKFLKKKAEYEEKLKRFEKRKKELAARISLESIDKCCKLVDENKIMVSTALTRRRRRKKTCCRV